MVMSNAKAVGQLLSLFNLWKDNPQVSFDRGLNKFKEVFAQLADLRRWGPQDRVKETGLLERWRESLAVAGQSYSPVRAEIELWYRGDRGRRHASERSIRHIVTDCGGTVVSCAQIEEIRYHALLVDLPRQQVATVLQKGPQALRLLNAEEIMFVSPFKPMGVAVPLPDPAPMPPFRPYS